MSRTINRNMRYTLCEVADGSAQCDSWSPHSSMHDARGMTFCSVPADACGLVPVATARTGRGQCGISVTGDG